MDHSRHVPLAGSYLTEANDLDAVIYGPDDEKIGNVAHVHGVGATMQVIVDAGDFLALGPSRLRLTPVG